MIRRFVKEVGRNYSTELTVDQLEFSTTSVDSSQTLTSSSGFINILADATSAAIVLTLPSALGNNVAYSIKKIDSSTNFVTIDGYSTETIDGSTTIVLKDQYNYVQIVSDGTNWVVINEFINYIW